MCFYREAYELLIHILFKTSDMPGPALPHIIAKKLLQNMNRSGGLDPLRTIQIFKAYSAGKKSGTSNFNTKIRDGLGQNKAVLIIRWI